MTMRHVGLFRFHPGTTSKQVLAMTPGLQELTGIIPEIAAYQIGPDLGLNDASWDFAICADFADTDAYLTYRDHPEHQARIKALVLPITAERVAVQYRT